MADKENNIKAPVDEKYLYLIEKFAGYGFNKSHSAAYALISYQNCIFKDLLSSILYGSSTVF